MSFNNSVSIITGGASNIGKEIVKQLADKDSTVIIFDVDTDAGQKVANEYSNVYYYNVDVTNHQETRQVIREVISQFGEIDNLVNCVGSSNIITVKETKPKDFEMSIK